MRDILFALKVLICDQQDIYKATTPKDYYHQGHGQSYGTLKRNKQPYPALHNSLNSDNSYQQCGPRRAYITEGSATDSDLQKEAGHLTGC